MGADADWTAPLEAFRIPGVLPLLLLLSCAVQYLCVPETDQFVAVALLTVGLGVVEVITSTTFRWSRLAASFVVAWAGWHGAAGRGSAEIGALVSTWPAFAVAATAIAWRPLVPVRARAVELAVSVVVSSLAAAIVARTGALASTPAPAWRSAALVLPMSAASIALVIVAVQRLPGAGRSTSAAPRR